MRGVVGVASVLLACGNDRDAKGPPPATPLERSVADGLAARYAMTFVVTCEPDGRSCKARPSGPSSAADSVLPIRLVDDGAARDWQIDGIVVRSDAIEDYLRGELVDLGVPTTAHCGRRFWVLQVHERVVCELGTGGRAFAVVQEDGSTRVEVELDPAAAAARTEPLDPAREHELTELSRSYDEEVPPLVDGGVPDDAVDDE